MASLTEAQLGSVKLLIQTAPDAAIRDLETTLAVGSERHETMRAIQQMVVVEAADRRGRNAVFAPLTPLIGPVQETLRPLKFPTRALNQLWRGLKQADPAAVRTVIAGPNDYNPDQDWTALLDALAREAAEGFKARSNPSFAAAAEACEAAMPQGAERFAAYLDLVPVARRGLSRMHEWLGRLNEQRAAAARLTFRDATTVAEDAGPRLMEILYAYLEEPWAVLRLVSAVMHRPGDSYVANSELATFGERLLDDIDERLATVCAFHTDGGPQMGALAGDAVRIAALEIAEFDDCIDLSRDGPWGSRLGRQRRALALAVEGRIRGVEADIAAALPLRSAGYRKGVRGHPRLTQDPDPRLVNRARAVLTLMHEVRGSADKLGFGALWNKEAEAVNLRLDGYVEDLLEKLRTPEECDDLDRVRAFIDIAAEFMGLVCDDKTAQIVRRRVAAAA